MTGTKRRSIATMVAAALAAVALAKPATAQITVTSPEVESRRVLGLVVDAANGLPIEGVYVLARSTQSLTRTNADGEFELTLPEGPQTLVFSRIGYGEFEATVDPPDEDRRVRVEAVAVPTELPGLTVETRSFQTRLDSVNTLLDRTAKGVRWRARGLPRFASIERIRRFDDVDDPVFALKAMGVTPDLMETDFCGIRIGPRTTLPTIFIDGKETGFLGCDRFREMDVSQICRMELIPYVRRRAGDPRGLSNRDLFVWTCGFLARVAAGDEAIPDSFGLLVPSWWAGGRP